MAITNASTLAEYASGISTQGATLTVDANNKRVGIGTTNPQAMLQVGTGVTVFGNTGIASFTSLKLSGDTDSTSVSTGALTVTGGVGIGLSLTVGGDVSVGGTITYEDVTNVDSLGIVTARSGLRVVGGGVTCVGVATFFNDILVGGGVTCAGIATFFSDILVGRTSVIDNSRLTIAKSAAGLTTAIALHNADGTGSKIISTRSLVLGADADSNTGDDGSLIAFETNGTEKVRIDSDGKVGIGTADPATFLHAYDATTNEVARFESGDSTVALSFRDSATTSNRPTIGGKADDMFFQLGGAEKIRIKSDGKVLLQHYTSRNVGGAANQRLVQIEGTTKNDSSMSLVNNQNNGSAPTINFGKTRGSSTGDSTIVQDGDDLGAIEWTGADGVDLNNATAALKAIVNGSPSENTIPTDIAFLTGSTVAGKEERFRIESDGDFRFSSDDAGTNYGWIRGWQSATGDMIIGADQSATGTGTSKSNLIFRSRGSEKLRITGIGSVGIGTDDPDSLLHLFGSADTEALLRLSSGSNKRNNYIGVNGNDNVVIAADEDDEGGASFIRFKVDGDEVVRLDSSGRLLIADAADATNAPMETFSSAILQLATGGGATMVLGRNDTSVAVDNGIGNIYFDVNTASGGAWNECAKISCAADGTHADGDYPSRLTFHTTADSAATVSERMRIAANGQVRIGDGAASDYSISNDANAVLQLTAATTPKAVFIRNDTSIADGNHLGLIDFHSRDGGPVRCARIGAVASGTHSSNDNPTDLIFHTCPDGSATDQLRMRINSEGYVGIGTNGYGTIDPNSTLELGKYTPTATIDSHNTLRNASQLVLHSSNNVNDSKSGILFSGALHPTDGCSAGIVATHENVAENSETTSLAFYTTQNETLGKRVEIDPLGRVRFNTTVNDPAADGGSANNGTTISENGYVSSQRSGGASGKFGRVDSDGIIVNLYQDGTSEGNISVSGSTVSYNGGHLSRWSQLVGISTNVKSDRPTIYQGTVMSNLDAMCEWPGETNQQLNKTKVSDTASDKDVAGVFWAWDDDDDEYTNDFYIAMTGDMVIRVAGSTTVARGDLLESAGDGTAKPQSDDIIRSKTVAKIISTTSTATYADGSKAYPCVLMAS